MKPTKNDRGTACRLLRQLREQRGWSWADQARALRAVADQLGVTTSASTQLSSLQRSIARWESTASRTVPGERYQLLLAQLYARNRFGELALGAGSDFDTLLTALDHHGVSDQRTRELRDLVVRSTSVDDGQLLALLADPTRRLLVRALRGPQCLDVELIDHLAASVSEVDRQISSVPFARHDSVDTTAAAGGRVSALRIGRARRELAPWRTESFVTELAE